MNLKQFTTETQRTQRKRPSEMAVATGVLELLVITNMGCNLTAKANIENG